MPAGGTPPAGWLHFGLLGLPYSVAATFLVLPPEEILRRNPVLVFSIELRHDRGIYIQHQVVEVGLAQRVRILTVVKLQVPGGERPSDSELRGHPLRIGRSRGDLHLQLGASIEGAVGALNIEGSQAQPACNHC